MGVNGAADEFHRTAGAPVAGTPDCRPDPALHECGGAGCDPAASERGGRSRGTGRPLPRRGMAMTPARLTEIKRRVEAFERELATAGFSARERLAGIGGLFAMILVELPPRERAELVSAHFDAVTAALKHLAGRQ